VFSPTYCDFSFSIAHSSLPFIPCKTSSFTDSELPPLLKRLEARILSSLQRNLSLEPKIAKKKKKKNHEEGSK
jgi:hypothetical protein